jgi:hypothetical protein
MDPTFFATPADFRDWLAAHHATADELWVGFYKKGSGRPSITWPESVDEALCYGWIDGLRRRLDDERYVIRFTPRRRGSIWSEVNTRRADELIAAGQMQPAGLAAYEARDPDKSQFYTYEARHQPLAPRLRSRVPRRRRRLGLLGSTAAPLPPRRDPLGHERQARRDAPPPAGDAHYRLGRQPLDRPLPRVARSSRIALLEQLRKRRNSGGSRHTRYVAKPCLCRHNQGQSNQRRYPCTHQPAATPAESRSLSCC